MEVSVQTNVCVVYSYVAYTPRTQYVKSIQVHQGCFLEHEEFGYFADATRISGHWSGQPHLVPSQVIVNCDRCGHPCFHFRYDCPDLRLPPLCFRPQDIPAFMRSAVPVPPPAILSASQLQGRLPGLRLISTSPTRPQATTTITSSASYQRPRPYPARTSTPQAVPPVPRALPISEANLQPPCTVSLLQSALVAPIPAAQAGTSVPAHAVASIDTSTPVSAAERWDWIVNSPTQL